MNTLIFIIITNIRFIITTRNAHDAVFYSEMKINALIVGSQYAIVLNIV